MNKHDPLNEISKIHIGEGCFGPDVSVNDHDLFISDSLSEKDIDQINILKSKLLKELELLIPILDVYDLRLISEIVVKRGQWDISTDDSYDDDCEQCGNYNWGETYTKK